ncbi:MAG TPA: hypothetical protein VFB78_19340 [Acidimicrobiales bacterium]|nr:hypothetical protein [Acidimicrobiales bacterium]
MPATIDIPYLNRVFLALEKINGDATRLIVANRRITPEAANLLHSILTDDAFHDATEVWNEQIDGGLAGFRADPGDRKIAVTKVLAVRVDCVAVEVSNDYNAVRREPIAPSAGKISLASRPRAAPNPTSWVIAKDLKSGNLPCA